MTVRAEVPTYPLAPHSLGPDIPTERMMMNEEDFAEESGREDQPPLDDGEMEVYRSSDLVLAAYLCTMGHKYEKEEESGVLYWVFNRTPGLLLLVFHYLEGDGSVEPVAFQRNIVNMKKEMFKTQDKYQRATAKSA